MMWPSRSTTSVAARRLVLASPRCHRAPRRGADRRLVLQSPLVLVVEVADDDLEHAGDGDGEQRAEDAEQLDADEHADEDGERVEVHRPRHDRQLQDVVLELLVDDVEDQRGDARPASARKATHDGRDGAEGGADQRDQVGEGDPQAEHAGERHAGDRRKTKVRDAGDDADEQVAGHVAR